MPDCRSSKKLTRALKNLSVCFYFQPSVSEMMASFDECSRVTVLPKCHYNGTSIHSEVTVLFVVYDCL